MPIDYLHNHKQLSDLIRIVAEQKGIDPVLVEKDYWIMHCLYGLQKLGLTFELKGGTSLSKGFKIIDRFSEDIDIHIDPPASRNVKTGRNQNKPAHAKSREDFYDWLANTKIKIDGIDTVERDAAFDSDKLFRAEFACAIRASRSQSTTSRTGFCLRLASMSWRRTLQRISVLGCMTTRLTTSRSSTIGPKALLVTILATPS